MPTDNWIRMRGRADYRGWKLHVTGPRAELVVGHPFIDCVSWYLLYRLRLIRETDITGKITSMRLIRPDAP